MAETRDDQSAGEVSYCSSLADDVWHGLAGSNAFESWHFDAVSDDGREALAIAFYDNYPLSPRFHDLSKGDEDENGTSRSSERCPAVSLVYSVDGKAVLDGVNEYGANEFHVNSHFLDYTIGDSNIRIDEAEYGVGFFVTVDIRVARGRHIRAELEWLLIESSLSPRTEGDPTAMWNLVAPRADVSGKIMLLGRRGKVRKLFQFRGTGYHDHISSRNVHYRDLSSRVWGRAHFVDATVVFDRHGGVQNRNAPGRFFLIRDGKIEARTAECEASGKRRDKLGIRIPRNLVFHSGDGILLSIKPVRTVRSGLSEVKVLCEVSLDAGDGKQRQTIGFAEFIDPRRIRNPVIRWIGDLKVGRSGRSPVI